MCCCIAEKLTLFVVLVDAIVWNGLYLTEFNNPSIYIANFNRILHIPYFSEKGLVPREGLNLPN